MPNGKGSMSQVRLSDGKRMYPALHTSNPERFIELFPAKFVVQLDFCFLNFSLEDFFLCLKCNKY